MSSLELVTETAPLMPLAQTGQLEEETDSGEGTKSAKTPPPNIKLETIIQATARHYPEVSRAEILSDERTRRIVRPRQVAMYLAKMLTTRGLPEIGRRFGGRDHTTVLHSVRKIEQLLRDGEPGLADTIVAIKILIVTFEPSTRSRLLELDPAMEDFLGDNSKTETPQAPVIEGMPDERPSIESMLVGDYFDRPFVKRFSSLEIKSLLRTLGEDFGISEARLAEGADDPEIVPFRMLCCLVAEEEHMAGWLSTLKPALGHPIAIKMMRLAQKARDLMQTDHELTVLFVWLEDRLGLVRWGDRT